MIYPKGAIPAKTNWDLPPDHEALLNMLERKKSNIPDGSRNGEKVTPGN